jgi:hypothetical protein
VYSTFFSIIATWAPQPQSFRSSRPPCSGSALLIVLGCVALLTILVTAFLLTAGTEFTTSNFYAKGVNTKLLSENVINLVMSQLREGARSTDVNTSAPVAWASQPGMIRTYDNTGRPYKYFKLYSWNNMVGSGSFDDSQEAETPPAAWAGQPNVYTDLNEPVNGLYPILDPGAENNVEGFSLNLPSGFTTATSLLPMPVKWLYILKDGTVTVGAPVGAGTAVHITNATVTNPIIGRVAFWTDDETSKVNINTASEGIFWDQPYGNNTNEMGIHDKNSVAPFGFAESIPSGEEFQRTPGHPATTSLSVVFGYGTSPVLPDTSFGLSDANPQTWPLSNDAYTSAFAPYFSLTPQYQSGGTQGGSLQDYAQAFILPSYRLYDSVDELAFDPGRQPLSSANGALYLAANGAAPPGRQTLGITSQMIQQRRFFITAHSRAPEETLFGTPRVSLWPLQDSTQALVPRTAKDNLLAFCSTINNQPYYFQRAGFYQYRAAPGDPTQSSPTTPPSCVSSTEDFPAAPTSALQTGVARNENLYAYLQALTGGNGGAATTIPGFGGNFLTKYPGALDAGGKVTSDRDEILTEMFDFLRAGVNTFNSAPNVLPNYTYTPIVFGFSGYPPNPGEVIPIAINTNGEPTPNTHGLGRTYNLGSLSLVFMAQAMALNNGIPATKTTAAIPATPAGTPNPLNPKLMSIGVGLPWAVTIDPDQLAIIFKGTPAAPSPCWLYWDTATRAYGAYVYEPSNTTTGNPALVAIEPSTNQPQVNASRQYVPLVSAGNDSNGNPGVIVTIADPETTAVQAFVLLNPHTILQGIPSFAPSIRVRVTGLDQLTLAVNGASSQNLGFPSGPNAVVPYSTSSNAVTDSAGGFLTPFDFGQPADSWNKGVVTSANSLNANATYNDGNPSHSDFTNYPLVGVPIPVPAQSPSECGGEDTSDNLAQTNPKPQIAPPPPLQIHDLYPNGGSSINTMALTGGTLKIDVFDPNADLSTGTGTPIQTFYIKVPSMTLPVPTIEMANTEGEACGAQGYQAASVTNNSVGPRIPGYVEMNPQNKPPVSPFGAMQTPAVVPTGTPIGSPYPIFTTYNWNGFIYSNSTPGVFQPLNYYWQQPWDVRSLSQRFSPWLHSNGNSYNDVTPDRVICHGDVVRSFVPNPTPGSIDGDIRLLGANPIRPVPAGPTPNLATDDYIPLGAGRSNAFYTSFPTQGPYTSVFIRMLHALRFDDGSQYVAGANLIATSQAILQSPVVSGQYNAGPIGYIEGSGGGITQTSGQLFPNETYPDGTTPNVTPELQGAFMDPDGKIPGDWTLGQGPTFDGPIVQKSDEAMQPPSSTVFPYYSTAVGNNGLNYVDLSYSPNRQIASAISFGSLPSRAVQGMPWCTLLFCPNPAANDNGAVDATLVHPGFGVGSGTGSPQTGTPGPSDYPPYTLPPDHLFLDLFWMPVVEPYAISEPFSTAGKVNMNYEIVPFGGYIHRSTGLHAVLKSEQILAVPTHYNDLNFIAPTATTWPNYGLSFGGSQPSFKASAFFYEDATWGYGGNPLYDYACRYGINLPATLGDTPPSGGDPNNTNYQASAFYQRFNVLHDIFRSATEICNVFLVPEPLKGLTYSPTATAVEIPTDASYASMQKWWSNFKLTGDNGREDPYNRIYPRLTTKSNDFQVHMRVQVLSQTPADRANGNFDTTGGDSVVGEYRGSAIVERYLDPNQTNPPLPDFATSFPGDPTSTVDNYVHYRVVSTQAFSP